MISNGDSLVFAMQEMQDSYVEWQKKKDGFLLYVDFIFDSEELLREFQSEISALSHLHRVVTYSLSFGFFPRPVRMYFCPVHAAQPLQVSHEQQRLISDEDSLVFAIQEMQKHYVEWQSMEDGVLLSVDFRFASSARLYQFQRRVSMQDNLHPLISYGPACG
jgi:hypothetical protein